MKKTNNSTKLISIAILILMGIILLIKFIQENRNERLLENYKITTAKLLEKKIGAVKSPKSGKFIFKISGKRYEFSQSGDFLFMDIGDTVQIKYAVENPSIAKVIDKYYMKKYKYPKNE